ncbi:MAG: hypothetical protein PHG47_10800 [Sulfuricella sp.]|nr:hypothetical protein [Sulfuricella sp.]
MQRSINLILSATLTLACASAMAEGRPAEGRPAGAPAAAEAIHQHDHHDHALGQIMAPDGKPAAAAVQGKWQGREWTKYPLLTPMMGRVGDRAAATLAVKNLQPAVLEVFAAEGPADRLRRQFPVVPEGTPIEAVTPKIGNYHWVSAREEAEGKVTVASTAYFFGNPGVAPTKLLLQQKSELEIIPQPLPREHGAWRESEKWRFMVRFNGQPLANQTVKMETEFGTRTAFVSDEKGMATVLFPRDFKSAEQNERGGRHGGPRKAKFVLAAERDDGGKHYLTAFNYTYSPDSERDKSLLAGVGFGVFGMLLATPLLRRKKSENNHSAKEA